VELFSASQPFWKGNLHMHTTRSDGALTPEEAVSLYRAHGYDFVALTDHDVVGCDTHVAEGGMLVLSGIELAYELPAQEMHLVGISVPKGLEARLRPPLGPQAAVDVIRGSGGRAILAHPAWSLLTCETVCGLRHLAAAEIYNAMSGGPRNGLRADSSAVLDSAAAHGQVLPLVAVDDAHFYEGEHCNSFVMVQAEALTQAALLGAIDEGRFYASQGPTIRRLSVTGERILLECSPVSTIVFYSNLPWVSGRRRTGSGLTQSVYELGAQEGETFVRCQIIDAEGRSAWTNPIAIH
jgi:hypothetical protein